MKIFGLLIFVVLTTTFADKKTDYLRLEIKELHRECSNLQRLIFQYQQQQQILTSQLEKLGSDRQKIIKYLTRQNVKAQMRKLVFRSSNLLAKEKNLKQLLDRKSQQLLDILWQKIHYVAEIRSTQTQKQIAKVIVLLREINILDKNNQKISLPFFYQSKWDFHGGESIAEREEKKWLLIHCKETYVRLQKKFQQQHLKLKKRVGALTRLNALYKRRIINQKLLELKIRSKNISNKLTQIDNVLRKTKANLLAIQKQEQNF